MQLETVKFTPNDLAKYPFLKETAEYMRRVGLEIDEITSPKIQILSRAQERPEQAFLFGYTGKGWR